MKKKIKCLIIAGVAMLSLSGCNANKRAKEWGGTETITLPRETKLELVTWKDSSLWYLTRPMREDESPETHIYKQKSPFGVIEGEVIFIETR